jgi:DNA modification methylase
LKTKHFLYNQDSTYFTSDKKADLIITSPPYPMIEMWDSMFTKANFEVGQYLKQKREIRAWRAMHDVLEKVWRTCDEFLVEGGFICINIGNAFRTLKHFRVYPNTYRVIQYFNSGLEYQMLPSIYWHKQTNAPTKFMGSGMLPKGAYVKDEFEHILIFRKPIDNPDYNKDIRRESAYFYDERNKWFNNIWDVIGTTQKIQLESRERSGAFPFEIPYRLINMYSQKYDTVLDPFAGLGTTTLAAMATERNSISIELMSDVFKEMVKTINDQTRTALNHWYVLKRLESQFANAMKEEYTLLNEHHNLPVKTNQETDIKIREIIGWEELSIPNLDLQQYNSLSFSTKYSDDLLFRIKDKFERTKNSLHKWM